LYCDWLRGYHVLNLSTGEETSMAEKVGQIPGGHFSLIWSPSGHYLAFSIDSHDPVTTFIFDVEKQEVIHKITPGVYFNGWLSDTELLYQGEAAGDSYQLPGAAVHTVYSVDTNEPYELMPLLHDTSG